MTEDSTIPFSLSPPHCVPPAPPDSCSIFSIFKYFYCSALIQALCGASFSACHNSFPHFFPHTSRMNALEVPQLVQCARRSQVTAGIHPLPQLIIYPSFRAHFSFPHPFVLTLGRCHSSCSPLRQRRRQ